MDSRAGRRRDRVRAGKLMRTRLHASINQLLIVMLVLSWACKGALPIPPKTVHSTVSATVGFFRHEATNHHDQTTLEALCRELRFSVAPWTSEFVNDEANWFDEKGQRKLDIFIVPGGDSYRWFEKKIDGSFGIGINEKGCRNIVKFIESGGSCIGICHVGPALFARTWIWKGLTGKMVEDGMKWGPYVHSGPGGMLNVYGVTAIFKGTVMGPQESNIPYPRVRFLPIELNQENPIVKKARLPHAVHLMVAGGSSQIPTPSQPIEVIGWFPNGTAAISVLKHGNGHLYMVAPHPNITLENGRDQIRNLISGKYARMMGLNDQQINEAVSILNREGDRDGPTPDLMLMKAILVDAAERATLPGK